MSENNPCETCGKSGGTFFGCDECNQAEGNLPTGNCVWDTNMCSSCSYGDIDHWCSQCGEGVCGNCAEFFHQHKCSKCGAYHYGSPPQKCTFCDNIEVRMYEYDAPYEERGLPTCMDHQFYPEGKLVTLQMSCLIALSKIGPIPKTNLIQNWKKPNFPDRP